ncbi:sigma-70 family RNA polymerase sigma factor [Actinoplanes sp. TRM 88003]|uniref:Sigma-70 family RNA polymerase sigma factor n=1 Tax=Paractinoplanes aksuensis TaxID=2939490 RepID=A0ABT1DSK2_9ACTN|nr:sigma-70 family RNA polymerase sigma factor [Actinoplanes aksuensis]MCO8273818.1 sigma-70 family RNA polymerase sigma factor [Actinoplanes aksuensis]
MDPTREQELAEAWTRCRPRLVGIAYALLGRHAEAEDVVSESYLRLVGADRRETVRDVDAWGTVAVARAALSVLQSPRRRRESQLGPWLPELAAIDPAEQAAFHEAVSSAVGVVLGTLSPAERTAWALHELFRVPHQEVAETLGRTPLAVRQLVSRARAHLAEGAPRYPVDAAQHRSAVSALNRATTAGDVDGLLRILAVTGTALGDRRFGR